MTIQETMKAVMQAHQIVERFHKNVADLFRWIVQDLEEKEPSFGPLLSNREIWSSTIASSLRQVESWKMKHFAQPLEPLEDDNLPYLLVDVSIDPTFSSEPEVWLGALYNLEIHDTNEMDEEEAVEYLFRDYFGPEESWTEPRRWYENEVHDEFLSANLSFLRFPLVHLADTKAVQRELCDRLRERAQKIVAESSSSSSDEHEA